MVEIVVDAEVGHSPRRDLGFGLRNVGVADADESRGRVLQVLDNVKIRYAAGADDADADCRCGHEIVSFAGSSADSERTMRPSSNKRSGFTRTLGPEMPTAAIMKPLSS